MYVISLLIKKLGKVLMLIGHDIPKIRETNFQDTE